MFGHDFVATLNYMADRSANSTNALYSPSFVSRLVLFASLSYQTVLAVSVVVHATALLGALGRTFEPPRC